MKSIFVYLWFFIFLFFTTNQTKAQTLQYKNPLIENAFIADPFVLHYEGTYYLYGTTASNEGFKYWISNNLVDWQEKGFAFKKKEEGWGQKNFWAPEVIQYQDRFYMFYSAKGETVNGEGMRICVAVAAEPSGPFEEMHAPLFDYNFSCIDAHVFVDEGKPYLYYEKVGAVGKHWEGKGYLWGMIYGVPLAENLSGPIAEPTLCLYPSQDWEGINSMKARSNEGMTVFKRNGIYYMMYSGNHYADPNYGVGYATSDAPLGMWQKFPKNPILKNNLKKGISGPGHNSVLKIPNSKNWLIFYHSHANPDKPSANRVVNMDELTFDENGFINSIHSTKAKRVIKISSE
ncbi:glycoside hydrolase family 43 protein [Galbibacter mesophilus]|uniref:glycoside hydrolase family 43 protein n=1 Tax=Galbibacter mesophilus TaxID=379069 RepID=UPI00191E9072|nr:glycoside hydrolase family 43 protein [Galbibacter mesophilus]MCM5663228.1 glycoside hydrolase family 43 protein [Galbibacter mesophilus]